MIGSFGASTVYRAWLLVMTLMLPCTVSAASTITIQDAIDSIDSLYEELDYEHALQQIRGARELPRGTNEEVTLSLYEGIILFELGRQEQAKTVFMTTLLLRADAELPVLVAPKIAAFFNALRQQAKDEQASVLAESESGHRSSETGQVGHESRQTAVNPHDAPRAPLLIPDSPNASMPFTQEVPSISTGTPLTHRWYFWLGMGVVVSAAAIGTVMASQQQPLRPEDICKGGCDGVVNRPSSIGRFSF